MYLPRVAPHKTLSWQHLQEHARKLRQLSLMDLFNADPNRGNMHLQNDLLYFDYAKHHITKQTLDLFLKLAEECRLTEAMAAFQSGKPINETEGRRVLHFALRDKESKFITPDSQDAYQEIAIMRARMQAFAKDFHQGRIKGYSGSPLRHIVHIGIGGSDLGPKMLAEALRPYHTGVACSFISNIDAGNLVSVLKDIDPPTALFVIASKTFTTEETLVNAHSIRKIMQEKTGVDNYAHYHFAAVTANGSAALDMGMQESYIFPFGDYVGGRYSLWSSIGLSLSLCIGWAHFENLLAGAHQADLHFFSAPFANNIPFLMAVLDIWYRNFFHTSTRAVIVYQHYLRLLPDFLQQLEMESNGKSVDRNGEPIPYATSPVIFGGVGTDVQHSFFQQLHQGTDYIPCDFIAIARSVHLEYAVHHQKLLSHCLAQTESLMCGKENKNAPFQHFAGNKPSALFLLTELTPLHIGYLLALYEHKVFVQGILWNVYSFDQFGVGLGKERCKHLQTLLTQKESDSNHLDASTRAVIQYLHSLNNKPIH